MAVLDVDREQRNADWPKRQPVEPAVGMGVTQCYPSDRYPHTIVRVLSPTKIEVQLDRAILLDPRPRTMAELCGRQRYRFVRNPKGRRAILTLRRDHRWWEQGTRMRRGAHWSIGVRDQYRNWAD